MSAKTDIILILVTILHFCELTVCDPCSDKRYSVIDDYRRSPTSYYDLSEHRLCDNRIRQGWYRLKVNGTDAQIPTQCVKKGCGTRAPIWMKPPKNGLPTPGRKARTHACASFNVPGSETKCCGLKFPITVKNCGTYFVYRLRSTKGCDLAYCTEVIEKGCGIDQVYVLHLQKCVDIKVQISKPKLHVKQYPDRVSIVCLFNVHNITVYQHKPTFLVTWVRMRSGVSSIIRFKFITGTKDQIVLGKDVYTGDMVACEVMPVHQTQSKVSETLFLGIQVMETGIAVYENGGPVTLTFVSTVPLVCGKDSCKLEMVLTVKYPKGDNVSNIVLSRCILQFQPDSRCQGTGCITQQVKVAMTPNLHFYKVKEVALSGYIYVDDHIQWNQATVQTKIRVIDLPSASCYVTAGVFIMSFQESISKLPRRGTYILTKSQNNELEVHIRVNSCTSENLLCVCGIMVYYQQTKIVVDKCHPENQGKAITVQYRPTSSTNIKIYEGRHGKLIYVILDNKGQIRIDLTQRSMSLTIQLSGYYGDKVDGLCGHIGNNTHHSNIIGQLQGNWRLLPGQSMFENSSPHSVTMATDHPECDCSLSSYETSCPRSSTTLPQFLFQLKETTIYWLNKTKTSNLIQDYIFDGDFDDEEIVTKQPSKDGQLASDNCRLMFMTSGIAKTCLNKIDINIETVINICVALATSYRNSTWMPEVLRLLENLCETHLNNKENSIGSSDMTDINIEDIRQAILCPEGCYGNGLCTENGCFCYHGYNGIECLTRTAAMTTTSMPTATNKTTVTTTASTTTTTEITSPTTISTSLATENVVSMVTCDTRSMRCSTVHVTLMYSDRGFPYKCLVSLVKLTENGWKPVGDAFNTMLRYIDMSTVECMLPMVTDKENFPTIYEVQVPNMAGSVLTSQLVAVYDSLCQICDINQGCIIKPNTCFIDRICYADGSVSSESPCLKCESAQSEYAWSSIDNLPPLLESSHTTMTAISGDTVKSSLAAEDPENMDLVYTMKHPYGAISTHGEFKWEVKLSTQDISAEENRFVINVTDSCGSVSSFVLMVVVKPCGCLNGGLCDTQVVTSNRTGFTCSCLPSFTGKLCDTRMNSCHSNPCYPGVSCKEISNSFTCGSCPEGYQGDGVSCKKKCSADPCFSGVICTDHPTLGYVCGACPQYFYGNGEQCFRNNEKACNQNVCSPFATCNESSEYPGYYCGNCSHGYMGNGTVCKAFCFPPCTDGKECSGNGVCKCRHGYRGPGCTQAICNEPCQNGGICYQPDKCFCKIGYTGQFCETDLCPDGCLNGGSCLTENTCACLPGYRGHRCEIESCSITCLNGGSCVGFNRCRCTSEFTGTFCEQAICEPRCLNGGVCVRPNVCYCPMGYYGPQCERVFCYPPCENGGYCVTGNQCLCRPGHTGGRCQHKHCFKNSCRNGGRCVGPEMCACRAGWEGSNCGRPICHLGCQNGGYCYLPDRCRCPPNYWGPHCQFPSCIPPCVFGSRCTGPNKCTCRKFYTGKYCQRRKK